jgi:hypothetical protein
MSIVSIVLGVLEMACYWWVPTGMVLSLTGLLIGLVGWVRARRHSVSYALAAAAFILCLLALAFDLTVAAMGMETLRFTALR